MIPDVTHRHTSIIIRKFVVRAAACPIGAHELAECWRGVPLHVAVETGMNIPRSGATQAGKTTMLNCLSASIPPRERDYDTKNL